MNAPDSAPRPQRLGDEIAARLDAWIREQGLPPGAQLPTEKALCDRFGVSRPVIREAIARLKAEGSVRTRQGSGAFVSERPEVFRLPLPDALPQDAAEVFELRYVVETGAAALAAERRDEHDLQRIAATLAQMQAALDSHADAAGHDDAFHAAIAEATHNRALARFAQFMGQQYARSRRPTWSEAGHASGRAREAQDEHQRIFDAIAAGDAAMARQAAAAHLTGAARRLGLDTARWRALDEGEHT